MPRPLSRQTDPGSGPSWRHPNAGETTLASAEGTPLRAKGYLPDSAYFVLKTPITSRKSLSASSLGR
jgi:hypothetical protein